MFTAKDITGFFLDKASESRKVTKYDFQNVPIIEKWIGLDHRGKVIIKGRIYNHSKHPKGVTINTSGVKGYFSDKGRVFVTTQNSIYELGRPLNEVELIIKLPEMMNAEKMTIWN